MTTFVFVCSECVRINIKQIKIDKEHIFVSNIYSKQFLYTYMIRIKFVYTSFFSNHICELDEYTFSFCTFFNFLFTFSYGKLIY